jgi:hypothetical protein
MSAGASLDEARAMSTDPVQLSARLTTLRSDLGVLRLAHETEADGSYKRCSCDLCATLRRLEDPPAEVERLSKENDRLWQELDAIHMDFDSGLVNGERIRTRFNSAIGFPAKSPEEAAGLVFVAVQLALKDAEFKTRYDELREEHRERVRRRLKEIDDSKRLDEDFKKLSAELDALEAAVAKEGLKIDLTKLASIKKKHDALKALIP